MKTIFFLTFLLFGALIYGQTGINTPNPKATLDIRAKNSNGSTPEGIIQAMHCLMPQHPEYMAQIKTAP